MDEYQNEVTEPEIETIEEKEEISITSQISDELKYNPYAYIRKYYESMFPFIGGRVFSLLSLLPVSLILPKLNINNRMIRIHLNFLWLSPSGYAKSSIADEYCKITYNPLKTKKMTTPRLYHELTAKRKNCSLVVEDVSVWFMDEEKIKFLEGATGEEESVSHDTMRNIKNGSNKHVDVIAFCSGTAENITNQKIKTGILRRFSPLIVFLSGDEHTNLIKHIFDKAGTEGEATNSHEIQSFYMELEKIQDGYHEIKPIDGYIIPENIKSKAQEFFLPLTVSLHKKYRISLATESEQMFRFMCCHAFLNIFNKQKKGLIENNKIIIDESDLDCAKMLISREISNKAIILQCIDILDFFNIQTREQLIDWEERRRKSGLETPNEVKFIMQSNVK